MKIFPRSSLFIKVFFVLSSILLLVPQLVLAEQHVSIIIKSAAVKSQPAFWSTTLRKVSYGETLGVVGSESDWFKVALSKNSTGFIHASAVTKKKIVLTSNVPARTAADPTEVVLAGKGFSKQVEEAFAEKDPKANFSAVNEMEKISVSDANMKSFLQSGKLSLTGAR